jgi:excisionase family DNA binding protein
MTFVTPAVYTIAEACAVARIGRSTLYKHIRIGDLRAIKIGSRTCVSIDEFYRWLKAMPSSVSVLRSSSGNAGGEGSGAKNALSPVRRERSASRRYAEQH